ncbi:MAG: DUF4367 domain-containing protein [Oscillospiraceae bacterium]|nr:DUF4367 domain-containing protein [Oscillospiraceae bacterium]
MRQEEFFSQQELEQAAGTAARAMLECLPSLQAEHEFSPGFQAQMNTLLRQARRRRTVRRAVQRAALLALICLAGLALWTASQAQAGKAAVTWTRQAFSDGIQYSFTGGASAQALPEYQLSWLPEGYQESARSEGEDAAVYVLYRTAQGDQIAFRYLSVGRRSGFRLTLNRESYNCKTVTVNGGEADLYLSLDGEGDAILLWLDDEEGILFCLMGPLTQSAIVRMAQSLTLTE